MKTNMTASDNANAWVEEANRLYNGGHYTQAAEKYLLCAQEGITACQTFLGWMHMEGKGVSKNATEAHKWLELASASGDPEAEYYFSKILRMQGAMTDSVKYIERAASKDYLPALFWLAVMASTDTYGIKDDEKAIRMLTLASQRGHVFAKRTLAFRVLTQEISIRNITRGCILLVSALVSGFWITIRDPRDDRVRY